MWPLLPEEEWATEGAAAGAVRAGGAAAAGAGAVTGRVAGLLGAILGTAALLGTGADTRRSVEVLTAACEGRGRRGAAMADTGVVAAA